MNFQLPEELWNVAQEIITDPIYKGLASQGGRPSANPKNVLSGIFYWARIGCQVEMIPCEFGSASTIKRYLRRWTLEGVFEKIWEKALLIYDDQIGIQWRWQSINGAIKKAPYCKDQAGPNPTDRAKSGTKISILTDQKGILLAVEIAPANKNDNQLLEATLSAIAIERPDPIQVEQHLCGDKGYDSRQCRNDAHDWGYTEHIKSRGEEIQQKKNKRFKPKRWVVERTHSWLNRFRRIFVRWVRSSESYKAFISLAAAKIILFKIK